MKILDKYLLKTFLITFTSVFVILFFIFILQTVWLFISELAGKDLDFILIVKFLLFKMPSIIPMVLPLSVLLASIMTFGGLAENYEFAAMKSSGISFQRSMRPLTFFIVLLSIVALAFANNVIPYAEYKFTNFRRNIAQVKPAMAIVEGQFSKVGDYTIKVDKKSGENGNLLTGVIIHLKSPNGETNKTVIKAKRGELISNESSNTLKLVLFDGFYYEDVIPKKFEERQRLPFAKASFKKDIINIDLSKLNTDQETGEIANTNNMLSISELNYTLDSLNNNFVKTAKSYSENAFTRLNPTTNSNVPVNAVLVKYTDIDLLKKFNSSQKVQVLKTASSSIESTSFTLEYYKVDINLKQKNINDHLIALYEKFVIAFACILMFFIGAPLGSIIRKGGLGLPIVFAVTIFIIFHFINTFGKKVAQENGITPFLGTWMSTFVLGPLAIFLTYRAINDIGGMVDFEGIFAPIQKLFQAKKPVLQPVAVANEGEILNNDEECIQLNTYSDTALSTLVKNENEANLKNKAIKILSNRGILETSATDSNRATTQQLETLLQDYQSSSRITLFLYALSIITALIMNNNLSKVVLIILALVMVILFLISLAKSQQKLNQVGKLTSEEVEPGVPLSLLVGFPFYPIIYFYNTKLIKDIIAKRQ